MSANISYSGWALPLIRYKYIPLCTICQYPPFYSAGTDNHLILLNLTEKGMTGKELEKMLDEVHITVNKNTIPFDTQKPFVTSGVRLGTPAMTSRGMKEEQARTIARLIAKVIDEKEPAFEEVKAEVAKLCKAFPLYENDIM